MPVRALSLFGFLDEAPAAQYLASVCHPDPGGRHHKDVWSDARGRIGAPDALAGQPQCRPIDSALAPYLQQLPNNPRWASTVGSFPHVVQNVEIARVACLQDHVDADKVEGMRDSVAALAPPDRPKAILEMCLPLTLSGVTFQQSATAHSYVVESDDLNLRAFGGGNLGGTPQQLLAAGLLFGESSPLVQVMEVGGRYYLRNGYHRAIGLALAGEQYIPAIVLRGNVFADLEINFFEESLMTGPNPPTCGHFLDGTAVELLKKKPHRIFTVTWTEAVIAEP